MRRQNNKGYSLSLNLVLIVALHCTIILSGQNFWRPVNNGIQNLFVNSIQSDALGRLYITTADDGYWAKSRVAGSGVYRSSDNGETWVSLSANLPDSLVTSIVITPDNKLIVGTWNGIYISTDEGITWQDGDTTHIVPYGPKKIVRTYTGTLVLASRNSTGGIKISIDDGKTWISRSSGLNAVSSWSVLSINDTLLFAGTDYIGSINSSYGGTYKSTNQGISWQDQLLNGMGASLYFDPSTGIVYTGSNNGLLFRTSNLGDNWEQLSLSALPTATIFALYGDPYSNVYVGSIPGGLSLSSNYGNSWSQVNSGMQNLDVRGFYIDSTDYLYAANFGGGVYKSVNPIYYLKLQNNFINLQAGQTDTIRWDYGFIRNVNIYYSTNNGNSWQTIAENTTASDRRYIWTIPNTLSDSCLIKITDVVKPSIGDISSIVFRIVRDTSLVAEYSMHDGLGIDSSGNGFHLSAVGNAPVPSVDRFGRPGSAAFFNAQTEYFERAFTPQLLLNTYTINVWINTNSIVEGENFIVSTYEDTINSGYALLLGYNGFEHALKNNAYVLVPYPSNLVNTWIMLTAVKQNDSIYLYVNGELKGKSGGAQSQIPYSNNKFHVGSKAPSGPQYYFKGQMDELQVYNRRLSNTEIRELYNAGGYGIISVLTPFNGQSLFSNSQFDITWTNSGGTPVNLEFSTNNGSNWINIASNIPFNVNAYAWTVPNISSDSCKIRITDSFNSSIGDTSDGVFTIQSAATILLTSPNGGETWPFSSTQNITWTSQNIDSVSIDYSTNNGTSWVNIVTGISAESGIYNWQVPNTPSTQCRVRIRDNLVSSVRDSSNGVFTIQGLPALTLIAPNGGETWPVGSTQTITWTSQNIELVKIEFSTDNGTSWSTISNSYSASYGSYLWTIPEISSTNCRVRIISLENFLIGDTSGVFSIYQATPLADYSLDFDGDNDFINGIFEKQIQGTQAFTIEGWIKVDGSAGFGAIINKGINTSSNWSYNLYYDAQALHFGVLTVNPNPPYVAAQISPNNWRHFAAVKSDHKIELFIDGQKRASSSMASNTLIDTSSSLQIGEYLNTTWGFFKGKLTRFRISKTARYIENFTPTLTYSNDSQTVALWLMREGEGNILIDSSVNVLNGTIRNAVWSSDFPEPQEITIINPNGGEIWPVGSTQNITWTSQNIDSVSIDYSTNNGTSWVNIVTGISALPGIYTWTIPNSPSNNCVLRISDFNNPFYFVLTASSFRITKSERWAISNTNINNELESIFFINDTVGWACGNGIIIKTVDGGLSWVTQYSNFGVILNQIYFIDEQHGFVCGDNGLLLETINSGAVWSVKLLEITSNLKSIGFSSNNVGWVVGGRYEEAVILKTTNAGVTWDYQNINTLFPPTAISVFSDSIAMVVGSAGLVSTTSNGGENWIIRSGITQAPLNSCFIYNANSLWIVGQNGIMFKSEDGGENWILINSTTSKSLFAVNFTSELRGWVAGSEGVLLNTIDGGLTWLPEVDLPSHALIGLDIKTSDRGWCSGTLGLVLKYTNPDFEPSIELIGPESGTVLVVGSESVIKWRSDGTTKLRIEYSINNGADWNLIEDSVQARNGFRKWTIPNSPSNNCKIKITDIYNPAIFDVTGGVFSIRDTPLLVVLSPNGGENWLTGSTQNITWTSQNIDSVKIEVTTNGGNNWRPIQSSYPASSGTYAWTVNALPSTSCRIRITDVQNNAVYDSTDGQFTIILNPSPVRNSLRFDGIDDWVGGMTENIITDNMPFTLEAWVKLDSNTVSGIINRGNSAAGGDYSYNLYNIYTGQTSFGVYSSTGAPSIDLITPYHQWFHIACQRNPNGYLSVYVDGIKIDSSFVGQGAIINSPQLKFGKYLTGLDYLKGNLTRIRISNIARYQQNFNPPENFSPDSNTVGLWNFSEGSGLVLNDYSGNNLNGTIYGAPEWSAEFPKKLSVLSPSGGQVFNVGSTQLLKWYGVGFDSIKIEYTTNFGNSWLTIAESIPTSSSSLEWIIPNTPSNNCKIKITDIYNPATFDVTDGVFSIQNTPWLVLSSPNGGEQWVAGLEKEISWTSTGVDTVVIQYSANGGNWMTIESGIAADSNRTSWMVSNLLTGSGLMRIYNKAFPEIADSSDNTILIIPSFTVENSPLPVLAFSKFAWADYDMDGDFDVAVTGYDVGLSSYYTKIFRNTGGVFSDVGLTLFGVNYTDMNWGDYDNDGDLDLLISGMQNSVAYTKLFRNNSGIFTEVPVPFVSVLKGSSSFIDIDCDGDLDVFISGLLEYTDTLTVSKIYINQNASFIESSLQIPGFGLKGSVWTDIDNDGDVDLIISNRVYRNNDSIFTVQILDIPESQNMNVVSGDYDQDGFQDILISAGDDNQNGNGQFYLFRNNMGSFINSGESFISYSHSSINWFDFENDGDLDILLSGMDSQGMRSSAVYLNNAGSFSLLDFTFPLTNTSYTIPVTVCDINSDTDFDIIGSYVNDVNILDNNTNVLNTAPTRVNNLNSIVTGNNVKMEWSPSSDNKTLSKALTYNLRIGTTPGGIDIVSPMSDPVSGKRYINSWGRTGSNNWYNLKNLSPGKYYWAVQAIDNGFLGSEFSIEDSFVVINNNPGIVVSSPNGGETWQTGTQHDITWSSQNVDSVSIAYTTDNGHIWLPITQKISASSGIFPWVVPETISQNCKVKITYISDTSIFDLSDGVFEIHPYGSLNFEYLGSFKTPGRVWNVKASNGEAYLAESPNFSEGGLRILDVANPQSITSLGFASTSTNNVLSLDLQGDYAYLANDHNGLTVVNVTNPAAPQIIGNSDTPGSSYDVDVVDGFAYVADDASGGLRIINISNPTSPSEVGIYNTPGTARGVKVSGNYAYVADYEAGLRIVNISNPASPFEVGSYPTGDKTTGVDVVRNTAYLADGLNGLVVLNITNPDSPQLFDRYDFAGGNMVRVKVVDSIAYVAAEVYGVRMIDVSNPADINAVGYYLTPGRCYGVDVAGSIVYAAIYDSGLYVLKNSLITPGFSLISPSGSEEFLAGTKQTIRWNATSEGSLRILFSPDNGLNWQLIGENVSAMTPKYEWHVPNLDALNCLIKIENQIDPTLFDISDAPFAVKKVINNWSVVNINTDVRLYDVHFLNNDKGFAVGEAGTLFRTTDGGDTWLNYSTGVISVLRSIQFVNSDVGFISGNGNPNYLLKTIDGGLTWTPLTIPSFDARALYFVDSLVGWIGSPAGVWKTTNGGLNWVEQWLNFQPSTAYFKNHSLGWIAGSKLYKTTDGGVNWNQQDILNGAYISQLRLYPDNFGMMVGSRGNIFRTTNEGLSWNQSVVDSNIELRSYSRIGSNIWTAGDSLQIFHSSDAGQSWSSILPGGNNALFSVHFTGVNQGWATGTDGLLLKYQRESLSLLAPQGGENFEAGTVTQIRWSSTSINTVTIQYSTNSGTNWLNIIDGLPAISGSLDWTVPNIPSQFCLVRIFDSSNITVGDTSNTVFTITASNSISLISPSGGEIWSAGSAQQIRWTSALVDTVSITYSTNNGSSWVPVINRYPAASGIYNWTIPNTPSQLCRIRIHDVRNSSIGDTSAAPFTITSNLSLTLLTPNGGDSLPVGSDYQITWNYQQFLSEGKITRPDQKQKVQSGKQKNENESGDNPDAALLKILYSTNNGVLWNEITDSIPATAGVYTWRVPSAPSAQCLVRIYDQALPSLSDVSDTAFTIYHAPLLNIVSPVGGEVWLSGTINQIRWSAEQLSQVSLRYSSDNGSTWNIIAADLPVSSGNYDWLIPGTLTGSVMIEVYSVSPAVSARTATPVAIRLPLLRLITPNGGEVLSANRPDTVRWSFEIPAMVGISLSTDLGDTWQTVANAVNPPDSVYIWTPGLWLSDNCLMKVSGVTVASRDSSDAPFSIVSSAAITTNLSQINFGRVYVGSDSIFSLRISNTGFSPLVIDSVRITGGQFTLNNSLGTLIPDSAAELSIQFAPAAQQIYTDTMLIYNNSRQRLLRVPVNGEGYFRPSITLTSPDASENWKVGAVRSVAWNMVNVSQVSLWLSTDDGANWIEMESSWPAAANVYLVAVPLFPTTTARVKVVSLEDPSLIALSSPFTIFTYPAAIDISVNLSAAPANSVSGYRMFSLPGSTNLRATDVLSGEPVYDWQLGWDNGSAENYIVKYDGSDIFRFAPGRAFWLLTMKPVTLSAPAANVTIDSSNIYEIPIHNGWNQIANPFKYAVNWTDIRRVNSLPANHVIHYWQGAWSNPDMLLPYAGYYYNNINSLAGLKIPYNPDSALVLRAMVPNAVRLTTPFVGFRLTAGDKFVSEVNFGFNDSAQTGFDDYDYFAPPSDFELLNAVLVNDSLGFNYKYLAIDTRAGSQNHEYILRIRNATGQIATGKVIGAEYLEGKHIVLYDAAFNRFLDANQTAGGIQLLPASEKFYTVFIGTEEYIQSKKDELLVAEFRLYRNYPNPFNNSTVISFNMPAAGDVDFILYDILGRKVRSNRYHGMPAGYSEIQLDASGLSSGVYLYSVGYRGSNLYGKLILNK